MTVKETLIKFCKETKVYPPFTTKKIEKAGFQVSPFLLDIRERLEKADDVKTTKAKKSLQAFFSACEDLME